jgi:pimeloyl-ACP methyl ester carboxylesterase
MKRDYSAFCDRGASWTEEYVALPTGVELRSVTFIPAVPSVAPPVIFIPGMGSIIENFRETVIELTRNHVVLYIETREKASARISRKHRFSVEDITADIVHYAGLRFHDGGRYVMAGYSLGATAIAEAFGRLEHKPERIILVEPNISFPFHGLLVLLSRAAGVVYRPLKPLLKWYLRRFRIDLEEDPEMYNINCRILDSAEPVRLGAAVRHLAPYRMDGCLQQISVPTLVVVASSDRFHSHDGGTDIARRIANADYLDMVDNKRTHSAEMGRVIGEFISSPAQIPAPAGQP